MERIVQLFDVANLESAFRKHEARINYPGLRRYLAAHRQLIDTYCYVPQNPYRMNGRDALLRCLNKNGFLVRTKIGQKRGRGRWKCNFDVEMTMDMLRVMECSRPDRIIVCSGDGDMRAIYQLARERHVRIDVAATRENFAKDILLDVVSSFIDLGRVIAEQRREAQESNGNGAVVNAS